MSLIQHAEDNYIDLRDLATLATSCDEMLENSELAESDRLEVAATLSALTKLVSDCEEPLDLEEFATPGEGIAEALGNIGNRKSLTLVPEDLFEDYGEERISGLHGEALFESPHPWLKLPEVDINYMRKSFTRLNIEGHIYWLENE